MIHSADILILCNTLRAYPNMRIAHNRKITQLNFDHLREIRNIGNKINEIPLLTNYVRRRIECFQNIPTRSKYLMLHCNIY